MPKNDIQNTPAARVQFLVTAGMVYMVLKPGFQRWGMFIDGESR